MSETVREALLDKLESEIRKTCGKANSKSIQLTNTYYNIISSDIGEAIGGVNSLNAPFIVAALEIYSEAIRKSFPDIDKAIADVKKLPSVLTIKKGSGK